MLTDNSALIFCILGFAVFIPGGYALWQFWLRPFMRKRRFLMMRINDAPNLAEEEFWRGELNSFYKKKLLFGKKNQG